MEDGVKALDVFGRRAVGDGWSSCASSQHMAPSGCPRAQKISCRRHARQTLFVIKRTESHLCHLCLFALLSKHEECAHCIFHVFIITPIDTLCCAVYFARRNSIAFVVFFACCLMRMRRGKHSCSSSVFVCLISASIRPLDNAQVRDDPPERRDLRQRGSRQRPLLPHARRRQVQGPWLQQSSEAGRPALSRPWRVQAQSD